MGLVREKEGKEVEEIKTIETEEIGDFFKKMKRKLNLSSFINPFEEEEDELGEAYNVYVYKVLPYPPNTKEVNDFFVQKT